MIVMGLGNPGNRYADTRHNVGYRVTELLLEEPPVRLRRRLFSSYQYAEAPSGENGGRPLILIRYDGYMNHSGVPLPGILRRRAASAEDLLVVVDNMDLPPGTCRLRKGGGTAGHNGLKSIASMLGRTDFIRLYVGVGRPEKGCSVVDHVLGIPDDEDSDAIVQACIRAAKAVRSLVSTPYDRVAEELNRRES